jgi:hypothetical protein
MNNEPVAWINIEDGISNLDWDKYNFAQKHISLYTHPAKTLTDEEIKDFIFPQFVFEDGGIGMPLDEFLATVRAILKKAQGEG